MKLTKKISALIAVVACCGLTACAATGPAAGTATVAAPSLTSTPATTALASGGQDIGNIEARLQRLQDSVVMLEARLLDQQRIIESLKLQIGQGGAAAPAAADAGAAEQQSPTEIYLAAFGDYAAGRYQKSINGFSRFLQFFPANDYASNARYWLAECYLAIGQFDQSVTHFDLVVSDYPKSSKAPDALLKKAAALYQMNNEAGAIETIQLLKERYPDSSAAKNASDNFN